MGIIPNRRETQGIPAMDESFTVSIPAYISPFERLETRYDADVNTQRGRKTYVQARWGVRSVGSRYQFNLYVEIFEMHPDSTYLVGKFGPRGSGELEFEFDPMTTEVIAHPKDLDLVNLDELGVPWSSSQGFGKYIYGKEHGTVDWSNSPSVRKAGFTRFYIRIDGPGRDDRGNAKLDATIDFDFVLRHKDIESKRGTVQKRPIEELFKVTPGWLRKAAASPAAGVGNKYVKIVRSEKQPKVQPVPRLKAAPKGRTKVSPKTPPKSRVKASPKVRLKVGQKVSPKSPKRPIAKKARKK